MAQSSSEGSLSNAIALPLLLGILVFGSWFAFRERLITMLFEYSPFFFNLLHYVPSPLISADSKAEMAQLAPILPALDPTEYGWETFKQLMGYWGEGLRLMLIPVFGYLAVVNFPLKARYKYRRGLSLKDLAEQNKQLFPSIAPVLGKNLHKSNAYVGPWRVAQDYIAFASHHELLTYKDKHLPAMNPTDRGLPLRKIRKLFPHYSYIQLDKEKTDEVFRNQLGKPWRGLDSLDPLVKALCATFMAQLAGGDYRERAGKLLDQMSATFQEGGKAKNGKMVSHKADTRGAQQLIAELESHEDVRAIFESHAYEKTVIMALLAASRRKGKLPPNRFRWLRPVDRSLWYALHPVGGRKPWCEGAAAWTHYFAEKELGKAIATPIIEGATDGLEAELHKEQWIRSPKLWEAEQQAIRRDLEEATRHDTTPTGPKGRSGGQ